jgi:TPR repeat protein
MKAAKQGHTDAEFFISTCYGEGWGVAKDDAQEMVWLRKAAEQGHATSQYMLGWAYEDGIDGLPKDYAKAYFWLDLAALGEAKGSNRKQAAKKRDVAASHLSPADLASAQEQARKWFGDHPAQGQ